MFTYTSSSSRFEFVAPLFGLVIGFIVTLTAVVHCAIALAQ